MLEDEPEKIPDTEARCSSSSTTCSRRRGRMPLSASVMVNRDEFGRPPAGRDRRPARGASRGSLAAEGARRGRRARRARGRPDHRGGAGAGRAHGRTHRGRARGPAHGRRDHRGRRAPGAAQLRNEAEDYVDRKLAAFEVVLDRTMQTVQKGRERLQVHAPTHEDLLGHEAEEAEQAFFDQDE